MPTIIGFIDDHLKRAFLSLVREDPDLFRFLNRAFEDLKRDPFCGIRIQKHLWPKFYTKRGKITTLWKYDLPGAWRLIYTIDNESARIVAIVLEWMDHKAYERRFGYG